jgi:hypothetical protein
MNGVPVAIPLAWANGKVFFLQSAGFNFGNGSDCLRHRRNLR